VKLKGRRIRNLDGKLPGVAVGTAVLPALVGVNDQHDALVKAGFELPLRDGDIVLPRIVGPRSRFNAEGGENVHRDLPKEPVWRMVWTRWLEWHGPHEVEQYGVKQREYMRYPRTVIPPPEVSLRVARSIRDEQVVVTEPLRFGVDDPDRLLHEVNLLLELFGECDLLAEDLEPLLGPPTRSLNWAILPRGRRPWDSVRKDLEGTLDGLDIDHQRVAEYRLRFMHSLGPDFQAYGRGGFRGYVVFGFEDREVYVLESLYYGNATYVFGRSWEQLSTLTKADIIKGDLARARIVHSVGWERRTRAAVGE
jgi:hypothetical protein